MGAAAQKVNQNLPNLGLLKTIEILGVFTNKKALAPEFGRFRQIKSSQLFDYQRVQSFFNLLSCVHARACP